MKAIGFYQNHPISNPQALRDIEVSTPELRDHDLLVEVKAVSVNPVDTKVRLGGDIPADGARILGWDAAGIVRATGPLATRFKRGDRVWYAGDITRPGSNSELHAVDERIVGPMPTSLDFAEAASLPLTAITAWELLFDRLRVQAADPADHNVLLVIGAAGGVGSILTQLARTLTGMTVIGTASRAETRDWVLEHGAHHVINHRQPWAPQLAELGIQHVTHVASLNQSAAYVPQIAAVLRPEGQFALIDDPVDLDIGPFKGKSISIHWELMFTRAMFATDTITRQHALLRRVAELVDRGDIKHTLTQRIDGINAAGLIQAHALVEAGSMIGKVVIANP
ncbi:zinc-binding alcohol dehydrogenase family protein [Pollutimonas harenae]|uniref:Zinc-type alcohol dehydrogenase-like protein n=1 Tax=Pollutimonas harenae TaxID=657015 RepID=A0A853H560_9BURK|nr:zinc-binding alcohol dehydrogenase family protein [Pollutimonas harenae]NYT85254.1 zinc-binding alcohol dehydrogenase family protein [Pollutimonas harenae]TEA72378.1 zinc-binding alcohol dehydrogenase family protein [Pollutimonas harenae]